MVSNFRYHSFKEIDWRGKVNFIAILFVVGVFVVVSVQPALILCIGFYLYAISGPVITIRTVRKLKVAHIVGDGEHEKEQETAEGTKSSKSSTDNP